MSDPTHRPAISRAGSRRPGPDDRGSEAAGRSDGIRLRRGMGLLLITLLVPGSAQIAAGNRRLGRLAVRCWLIMLGVVVLFGTGLLLARGATIAVLAFPPVTAALCIAVVAAGIGWALLFADAWRIARPPELARQHRPAFALIALVLALGALLGSAGTARTVWAQGSLLSSVFVGGGQTAPSAGRINVLLLGADDGKGRVGLRPDSMTVASIDAETGRTVLFSIPRNLQGAPFPDSSPLKQFYPDGFRCAEEKCMINGVYTEATEVHKGLYPESVGDPGLQATREVIGELLGLQINYYAMIDLAGFEQLIDAVGGIRLDINKPIPVGGGSSKISRYIQPGKNVLLNGEDALWVARSRAESSDYDRMSRQKCVMNAMLQQLDPVTVLTKFTAIADAGKEIVETDIPTDKVDSMIELALKARSTKISSVAFVPPLIKPAQPDLALIRATVQEKIAAAEAADVPATSPPAPADKQSDGAKPSGPVESSKDKSGSGKDDAGSDREGSGKKDRADTGDAAEPQPANDDLGEVCSAA
ncbi:LCP family protein required for cell wall assembly [Naumannella cuiyingiana]|uniref:LCP family protein required for cell wall assembly n=1 Tax=Naumannella cuiyingiana TaxID=1347891 RepID=A0A7Z0IK86_9ACTN|nr:LCP family protein required for cell wall assembly [Naumannella cuiyingiana]